jgi:hypothetical protein
MEITHQRFQAFFQHMRVNLCRRDVGVAEERLHHPQVGAVVQKVARKGVAQDMGAKPRRLNSAGGPQCLELACEVLARQVSLLAKRREQPL